MDAEISPNDSMVRAVSIEYKNTQEKVFRTTRRAARKVAVLHREEDLEMIQELNMAARLADKTLMALSAYVDQQNAVLRDVQKCRECCAPYMCSRHGQYYMSKPFVYVAQELAAEKLSERSDVCETKLCGSLRIHTDPW